MNPLMNLSKTSNKLQDYWTGLLDIRDQLKTVPTCRNLAERLTKLCAELDEIMDNFIYTDHFGNK